jgi:hypothetical protein
MYKNQLQGNKLENSNTKFIVLDENTENEILENQNVQQQ